MDQEAAGHNEATDREREREMGVGVQLSAEGHHLYSGWAFPS